MPRDAELLDVEARCAELGLPAAVGIALREFCEVLDLVAPRAVLLLGSAARGELTWRPAPDGRIELFSDLELFCVAPRPERLQAEVLFEEIRRIEQRYFAPNPFFHIDCLVAPSFPASKAARGLLWWEGGTTHQLLRGDPGDYFGNPRPEGVSLGVINELVTIRLWWLAVHFPVVLLDGRALDERPRELMYYAQLRNLLDVLSIWLPNEGIWVPGYRGRLRHLDQHGESLQGKVHLPEDFSAAIADATRRKLTCELEGDPVAAYLCVVEAYEGLLGFLLNVPRERLKEALPETISRRWSAQHHFARSWRFRLYSAALLTRWGARSHRPVRWWVAREPTPAGILRVLLHMHRAAAAHLREDAIAAEGELEYAERALWRCCGIAVPLDEGSFAHRWHRLRAALVPFFLQYYRKIQPQARAVAERIESEKESLE